MSKASATRGGGKGGARLAVAGLAILGGLGVAVFAVRSLQQGSGRRQATGQPVTLPTGADKSLPTIDVGVATGYAQTQLIDTGPVNYDYIGPGWAYTPTVNDWTPKAGHK